MSLQILRKGENEMAKKEVKTDLWVARQLDDSKIKYDAQGSDVKEINDALQSASKRGTGNAGYPEYVAVVKDFVIVIEDKADLTKHQKLSNTGILSIDQKDIADYAVNGAYFYAKHIAQNSSFHKIFAIGVSGDEKHHKITPLYVDDRDGYKQLPDIESFTSFTAVNIDEYYTRYVLAEKTDVEKTTEEILKDAAELHEYLRTYGSLKDQDKPLVVSGILLALDDKFFKPDDLLGDETTTDGQLIYDAIQRRLKASNVGPDAKRDKLMSEFSIIRTSARLNEVDAKLGKTPLKFYTEFLKKNVFRQIIRTAFRMSEQPSMKLMFKGYQGAFPDKSFCKLRRRRKCENEQSAVTLPCLPVSFQHITCAQVGNKYELTSALIGQKSDLKLPPNSGEDVSVFYSQLGSNFIRIL